LSRLSRGHNTTRSWHCIAEFDRRNAVIARACAARPHPAVVAKLVVNWKAAPATNSSTDMVAEVTRR